MTTYNYPLHSVYFGLLTMRPLLNGDGSEEWHVAAVGSDPGVLDQVAKQQGFKRYRLTLNVVIGGQDPIDDATVNSIIKPQ